MKKIKSTKYKGTRLYNIYVKMLYRCTSDKYSQPQYYKHKGITVCKEWTESYLEFKEWAYLNGYSDNLSIDRVDSSLGYTPENCRWTTATTQARNTDRLAKNNKTGYRGVSFINRDKVFRGTQ